MLTLLLGPGAGLLLMLTSFLLSVATTFQVAAICSVYCPAHAANLLSDATLSPGFTTGLGLLGHYTQDHLHALYTTIQEAGVTAPVTVPIR